MTQQLKMLPEEPLGGADDQACVKLIPRCQTGARTDITRELESVANRVRNRLKNVVANILAIGRELQAVKQRLEHGQFLNWVQGFLHALGSFCAADDESGSMGRR